MKINKQLYYLAIDTSSKFLCVAVVSNGHVLAEYNRIHDRAHGKLLIEAIEKVLSGCRISLEDIDILAVNIGPGSFTGLRIAVATAKGLSLALGKPILGISSLDLMACSYQGKQGLICPIIDAKRKLVYSALYEIKGNTIKRKSKYLLVGIEELLKYVKPPLIFSGDAISLYADKIKKTFPVGVEFAKEKFWYPNPVAFAKLCFQSKKSNKLQSAKTITPFYLYPDTCTVRRKSKKSHLGKNKK